MNRRWMLVILGVFDLAAIGLAYYFGGKKGLLLAIAASAAVIAARWTIVRYRRRPPVASASQYGLLSMPSEKSLYIGAVFSLLVGVFIAYAIGFFTGFPAYTSAKLWMGFIIGLLYYAWCIGFGQNAVLTANRGVVLLWLYKRIPAGPDDAGLEEGLNWLPFGWPVLSIRNESVLEKKIEFTDCAIRTKDLSDFTVSGFIMVRQPLPHLTLGVEMPYEALRDLGLQALRDEAKVFDCKEFAVADKEALSDKVEEELRRLLRKYNGGDERRWGLYVVDLEITAIKPPIELATAWREPAVQEGRGRAENIKSDRRGEQAKKFKLLGVDANTALTAAMVGGGEPGAKMTNVAIEGLDEIGRGVGRAGTGFGEGLAKLGEHVRSIFKED